MGGWNPDRIVKNEEITWHKVVDKLFWSLKLDDIKVGGKSLGICDDKDCWMTPDSGTSQLCMPDWAYYMWLDTDWGNQYPCGEGGEQSRPELTFVIDGKDYSIPSHHWNERQVLSGGEGICKPTISPLTINQPRQENLFIIGDLFMQVFYSIFDRDNNRVGLAHAHHENKEEVSVWDSIGQLADTVLVDQL